MRRLVLDDSIRLLLNACAAAALLGLPACAEQSSSDGGDEYNDSDCGGGSWYSQDIELEAPGTVASLVQRGGQVFALLREGALVPVLDYANTAVEVIPGTDLRAWAELSTGDELVVGDGGQILRSASGSDEWTVVDAGLTDDLIGLATDDQGTALAIASNRVLHSADAGETWAELEAGNWTGLRRVFRAADQFWLIGDGGQVWTSNDPLAGWELVDLGTGDDLLDGFENGCSTCVVIVSASTLYMRTSDGGWSSLAVPEGQAFVAVGGRYVVSDRGIYEPTVPLADLTSIMSLDFTPIAVAGADEVYVAGSNGELVRYWQEFGGCLGRPWMIDGAATTAKLADAPTPAEGWARDGLFEHASVASFARFIGELLALGAPPSLIQAAQAAIIDELEHARLCFERAGLPQSCLGPLPLDPRPTGRAGDPVALALAVFDEGCIGESVAAAEAAVAAAESEDPDARLALERIAADERRHAALAWRTLRWLVDSFGEPVRAALRRRLATLGRGGAEIPARVIAELVRPLALELTSELDRRGGYPRRETDRSRCVAGVSAK